MILVTADDCYTPDVYTRTPFRKLSCILAYQIRMAEDTGHRGDHKSASPEVENRSLAVTAATCPGGDGERVSPGGDSVHVSLVVENASTIFSLR